MCLSLSNRQSELLPHLDKRKAIAPNLKCHLVASLENIQTELDSLLENIYMWQQMSFCNQQGELEKICHHVVPCKNVNSLIEQACGNRGLQIHLVKIGIDGGSGFLIICGNITSSGPSTSSTQRNPTHSPVQVRKKQMSLKSEVKKLFLLALVNSVTENYENVKLLFQFLSLSNVNFSFVIDLKLANIISSPILACIAVAGTTNKSFDELNISWRDEKAYKWTYK